MPWVTRPSTKIQAIGESQDLRRSPAAFSRERGQARPDEEHVLQRKAIFDVFIPLPAREGNDDHRRPARPRRSRKTAPHASLRPVISASAPAHVRTSTTLPASAADESQRDDHRVAAGVCTAERSPPEKNVARTDVGDVSHDEPQPMFSFSETVEGGIAYGCSVPNASSRHTIKRHQRQRHSPRACRP